MDVLYLLDTNILVHQVRRDAVGERIQKIYSPLLADPRPLISIVTEGELRSLGLQLGWGKEETDQAHFLLTYFQRTTIETEEILQAYALIDTFSERLGRSMGKNDLWIAAADHDFHPSALATPVGLLLPEHDELFVSHITSKVTSDCLVDVIEVWWQSHKARFPQVKTLVLNLDNGPECHSRRTQFLYRLVEFSHQAQLDIELAYYPPYHSKYNPIERCWGALEKHWNGDILDTLDTVVRFTRTMTWKGKPPVVELVTKPYRLGIKLTKEAMQGLESQVKRLPGLDKWFVHIPANLTDCGTLNSP